MNFRRANAKLQKRGVLWKIRKTEQEIAVAEDKGCLVKTYSCAPNILTQIEQQGIVEGGFIKFEFNTKRRVVVNVSYIEMRNHVSKWNERFAFVKSAIVPLIKLQKNGRLTECKFVENPQERESSVYIATKDKLDFQLKNNQYISFALCVNIQNTRSLRNRPYLDLVATHVKPADEADDEPSVDLGLGSVTTPKEENGMDDWLSRRMSASPRSPPKKKNTKKADIKPIATTLKVRKSSDSRRRNNSSPTKSDIIDKRDPCSKYSGPAAETVSAPATPLRCDNLAEDLPENYNDFCATFKRNQKTERDCLRCEAGAVCNHKPPRTRDNVDVSTRESASKTPDKKMERLQDENEYLKRELERMRSQMASSQKQPKASDMKPKTTKPVLEPIAPQRHISYTFDDNAPDCYNFPYDNIFSKRSRPSSAGETMSLAGETMSNSSPSVSPEREFFYEPEPLYDHLFAYGGKPSSARSDILSTRNLAKQSQQHYYVNKTPLNDSMLYPPCNLEKKFPPVSDNHSVTSASTYSCHDSDSVDGMCKAPNFTQQPPVIYGRTLINEDRNLLPREPQYNTNTHHRKHEFNNTHAQYYGPKKFSATMWGDGILARRLCQY